ncbi:hypothetical protein V6Z12_A05G461500 [Gossypium hirsutum]
MKSLGKLPFKLISPTSLPNFSKGFSVLERKWKLVREFQNVIGP